VATYIQNLIDWSTLNDMQLITSKTKEMVLGPLARANLPLLTTSTDPMDRVTSFKLLGVDIDSTITWTTHVEIWLKKPHKDCIS